jgi:hypothetical protein
VLAVIGQPDAWSRVERAQQIARTVEIKIIVDVGQSEQSGRPPN